MVRVAAKPSRTAKASGCPTAAVACSATGSAPLQATSARAAQWPQQPGRRVRIDSLSPGLRRGTFHRGKVPKTRRGLRPPVPCGAPRRASQEKASRKPLRSTGPSRPILPPPSRLRARQWNRMAVTATVVSSKAAQTAPEQGLNLAHSRFFAQSLHLRRRGAHCASERLW